MTNKHPPNIKIKLGTKLPAPTQEQKLVSEESSAQIPQLAQLAPNFAKKSSPCIDQVVNQPAKLWREG